MNASYTKLFRQVGIVNFSEVKEIACNSFEDVSLLGCSENVAVASQPVKQKLLRQILILASQTKARLIECHRTLEHGCFPDTASCRKNNVVRHKHGRYAVLKSISRDCFLCTRNVFVSIGKIFYRNPRNSAVPIFTNICFWSSTRKNCTGIAEFHFTPLGKKI